MPLHQGKLEFPASHLLITCLLHISIFPLRSMWKHTTFVRSLSPDPSNSLPKWGIAAKFQAHFDEPKKNGLPPVLTPLHLVQSGLQTSSRRSRHADEEDGGPKKILSTPGMVPASSFPSRAETSLPTTGSILGRWQSGKQADRSRVSGCWSAMQEEGREEDAGHNYFSRVQSTLAHFVAANDMTPSNSQFMSEVLDYIILRLEAVAHTWENAYRATQAKPQNYRHTCLVHYIRMSAVVGMTAKNVLL